MAGFFMAAFTMPPTPPNSGDPSNFNARADAMMGWFPIHVAELNAAGYPDFPTLAVPGSVTAPSFSFEVDPDTGLFRAGDGILAFASNGAERMRVTPGGAQVTGLLTGTAITQGNMDATANRIMKVGDFGIGSAYSASGGMPNISNVDATDTPSGMYSVPTGASGLFPVGSGACTLIVERYAGNWVKQTLTYNASTGNDGRTYIRTCNNSNGAWGPWRLIYTQATAIGTVSQASGVPTGALVEMGSNANGSYLKLPDGTMICRQLLDLTATPISTPSGSLFISENYLWTFPATFTGHVTVLGSLSMSVDDAHDVILRNATSGNCNIRMWASIARAANITKTVSLTAIGRWY